MGIQIEIEELISFYARRGEVDAIEILRNMQEEYERHVDPDYNPESDTDSTDSDDSDLVEEDLQVNPSLNGFCSLA